MLPLLPPILHHEVTSLLSILLRDCRVPLAQLAIDVNHIFCLAFLVEVHGRSPRLYRSFCMVFRGTWRRARSQRFDHHRASRRVWSTRGTLIRLCDESTTFLIALLCVKLDLCSGRRLWVAFEVGSGVKSVHGTAAVALVDL